MKALSLLQPWGSLIAWGEKRIETRSWSTEYRGLLAIHASKKKPTRSDIINFKDTWFTVSRQHGCEKLEDLPLGQVICIVRLVDVFRVTNTRDMLAKYGGREFMFGNYAEGRYGWKLELLEVFEHPIPAKGSLGLWTWERPAT